MANLFNYISWAAILIPFVTTKGGSVWMIKVEKDAFYSSNKVRIIDYSSFSSSSYFDKVMDCLLIIQMILEKLLYVRMFFREQEVWRGTISVLIILLARLQNPMILRCSAPLKRSGSMENLPVPECGSIFGQCFLNYLTTLSIFHESIKFVLILMLFVIVKMY